MGKVELVVDLNPGSRSARSADVPIVDNIVRALPATTAHAEALRDASEADLREIVDAFDPDRALADAEAAIRNGSFD
jgi:4-phosphopantoate--beta-alanine ligase